MKYVIIFTVCPKKQLVYVIHPPQLVDSPFGGDGPCRRESTSKTYFYTHGGLQGL
jgi:hypothetical protein